MFFGPSGCVLWVIGSCRRSSGDLVITVGPRNTPQNGVETPL
ncbi:hypothetical protein C731_0514 [Mycolicibacterium hassiacum DSM 44199]|uniref:Uncharacterized protein n=1 Tax=Mycolicibacterium hassiacum (strain DSM 44199 / CIP 105218 / JCM 12690 / 3849) TaxID=1122247 RepID=K5BHY9_MYCHD|nr:hypothetical protein C731_0514 [Mycolicibacterium hassiacum DSM 44199]